MSLVNPDELSALTTKDHIVDVPLDASAAQLLKDDERGERQAPRRHQ